MVIAPQACARAGPPPGMLQSGKLNIVDHRPLKADKPHLVIGEPSRAAADARAERLRAIVTPLAGQPNREIAKHLNDRHVPTARGGY